MMDQETVNTQLSAKKIKLIIGAVVVLFGLLMFGGKIVETNEFGNYQMKQAAISGEVSVRNNPGMYNQMFGSIFTYKISDENYFTASDEEGGSGEIEQPIDVLFSDGSTVQINGMIKYRLSQDETIQKQLHKDFKSYESVKLSLIRQTVVEALMQTATLMTAEELYSSRRAEFTAVAEEQIRKGIYETTTKNVKLKDDKGTTFINKVTAIKLDKDGNPIIRKASPFKNYKIDVLQFVIKKPKFDAKIESLIAKKKEAEQMKVVARAEAEKAKQDAKTIKAQGDAKIAKEKALAEVDKIKAVTNAKRDREVAEENALKAIAEAKATKAKGDAEAYAAKRKKDSGLTPQEKLAGDIQMNKDKYSNMKDFLKNVQIVSGGAGGDAATDPMKAVGLNQMMNVLDRMTNKK